MRNLLALGGFELSESAIPHAAHQQIVFLREQEKQPVLLREIDSQAFRGTRAARALQVDDENAARAEWVGFVIPTGAQVELTLVPVIDRARTWGGPEDDETPQLPSPWLNLELNFRGALTRTLEAAPVELDGVWTSALATRLASSTDELLLSRLEDWQLRDSLERRGVVQGIGPDYHELPRRPWLRLAAEQRARYEGADGYKLRRKGAADERFPDLQALLEVIE